MYISFYPVYPQPNQAKKSKITVPIQTNEIKRKQLLAKLSKLKQERAQRSQGQVISDLVTDTSEPVDIADGWVDAEMGQEPEPVQSPTQPMNMDAEVVICHPPTRCIVPDDATKVLYGRWLALLPELQPIYL